MLQVNENENASSEENKLLDEGGCLMPSTNNDVRNVKRQSTSPSYRHILNKFGSSSSNENSVSDFYSKSSGVSLSDTEPLRFSLSLETEDCMPSVESISPQNCLPTNVSGENTPVNTLNISLSEAFSNLALSTPARKMPSAKSSEELVPRLGHLNQASCSDGLVALNNLTSLNMRNDLSQAETTSLNNSSSSLGASLTTAGISTSPKSPLKTLIGQSLSIIGAAFSSSPQKTEKSPKQIMPVNQHEDFQRTSPPGIVNEENNVSTSNISGHILSNNDVLKSSPLSECGKKSEKIEIKVETDPLKEEVFVEAPEYIARQLNTPEKTLLKTELCTEVMYDKAPKGIQESDSQMNMHAEIDIELESNLVRESLPGKTNGDVIQNNLDENHYSEAEEPFPSVELENKNDCSHSISQFEKPAEMAQVNDLEANSTVGPRENNDENLEKRNSSMLMEFSVTEEPGKSPSKMLPNDTVDVASVCIKKGDICLEKGNSSTSKEFSSVKQDIEVSSEMISASPGFAEGNDLSFSATSIRSSDGVESSAFDIAKPTELALSVSHDCKQDFSSEENALDVFKGACKPVDSPVLEDDSHSGINLSTDHVNNSDTDLSKCAQDLSVLNVCEANTDLPATTTEVSEISNRTDLVTEVLPNVLKPNLDSDLSSDDFAFKIPEAPMEEEQFSDAVQFFKDQSSLQFLENIPTKKLTKDARSSLFVNFDPLHSRISLLPRPDNCALITQAVEGSEVDGISRNSRDASLRESTGNILISFDSPLHSAVESKVAPVASSKMYTEEELQHQLKSHELSIEDMHLKKQRGLEEEGERKLQELQSVIDEKDLKITQLSKLTKSQRSIMEEIKIVVSAFSDKDQGTSTETEALQMENTKLKDEVKTLTEDLQSVETTFADFHKRYEQLKVMLKTYKENEVCLKQDAEEYRKKVKECEKMYQGLQDHTTEVNNRINSEIENAKKANEAQVLVLKAQLRKSELKVSALENEAAQLRTENESLSGICNELMEKVTTGGNCD